MKRFCGYIRVSTAKQGEQGVSLQEQRSAIESYAQRYNLAISTWFEERETAAKRGRPVFSDMIRLLTEGRADGVIIHKIDRSARNLRDWADLGELIDRGIDVHFANESLDLHSRGGRLSADIQAVVAADYIRNLREETKKGIYGRLKQGIYPLPAPIGYLNKGKGQPKEIDPQTAPLVRRAFELYATGRYTLITLGETLQQLGLRTTEGKRLSKNGLSVMLNNPFYIGLMRLKGTGETFPGIHQPLIRKSLFDRVQVVLAGKAAGKIGRHTFLFRRLLVCRLCGYAMTGEHQKGHTYYRCHTTQCPTFCVREEQVEETVLQNLSLLQFNEEERAHLERKVVALRTNWKDERDQQIAAMELNRKRIQDRLGRLTDAYLDEVLERRLFEERKSALLLEEKALEEKQNDLRTNSVAIPDRVADFLELAGKAYVSYKMGMDEEKRDLLKVVTSNRLIERKNVSVELKLPFQMLANRHSVSFGAPRPDRLRIRLDQIFTKLCEHFSTGKGAWQDVVIPYEDIRLVEGAGGGKSC